MSVRPATVEELQRHVHNATRVGVRGGGTKSAPSSDDIELGLLSGLEEYSPEECVFTARAGTPVRTILETLGRHGQYLPFDPPFADDGATIGGTVAAGVSGPKRYRYGGVRDFLIGIRVVDGEGRLIRSGGKVVKNAAGFLLHHGMVGSCGRFGVITEVTFKVFPAPEARRTFTLACGSVDAAFAMARRVEHQRLDCESIDFDESGGLRITLAGRASAIDARLERLQAAIGAGARSPSSGTEAGPGDVASGMGGEATRLPSARLATGAALVKVAGAMKGWQKLRPHVTAAQFMCAGSVAWLTTDTLPQLAHALDEAQLVGQVIRGADAGRRIGAIVHNEFEERVRRVLDPHDRFSAAPHSHR
jgi:glycolate oxidase FAD binding subunit